MLKLMFMKLDSLLKITTVDKWECKFVSTLVSLFVNVHMAQGQDINKDFSSSTPIFPDL